MYCSSSAYNRCLSLRRRHKMAYKNSPVFFFSFEHSYISFPYSFEHRLYSKPNSIFFKPQKKQIDILRTDQIFLF